MTLFTRLKKRLTSTSIFSVDPSIQNTGYAVLSCSDSIQVSQLGIFFSDPQLSDERRIRGITDDVCHLAGQLINPVVILEKPPGTIYGQKILTKDAIVARAASLFQLFTLYGSLISGLELNHISYQFMLPIEWQRLVKRPKHDVKKLSLALANDRLHGQKVLCFGSERRNLRLKTKLQANMADAMNIGYHYWLHCREEYA